MSGRWAGALVEWQDVLERSGRTPATIRRQVRQVKRFANEAGSESPWDTTPAAVTGWLDGLPGAAGTLYTYRTSLRVFFGWAVNAGRMGADPTTDMGGRLVKNEAPPLWRQPVRDFRRYLLASGAPATTIKARTDQLVNAARTLGVPDPWAVTAEDLAEWMGTRGWARETLRARRSTLRKFYTWAVDMGHATVNPALALPRVPPAPPMPRPAPDEAIAAAMDAADPRERLMIRLAADVGLRRAEIACLRTGDIEQAGGGWWLWVRGKGDRVRRLPIADDIAADIRQRPAGWLFPGRDRGRLSPRWVGTRLSRLLPPGLTAHTLRHSFATLAYDVQRDVLTVQKLLGHASPATTERYVVVPDDYLRSTVNAMRRPTSLPRAS